MRTTNFTIISSLLLCLLVSPLSAQFNQLENFDGTINEVESIKIILDSTDQDSIWEIGTPSTNFFDAAYSEPNALVTNLDGSYEGESSFSFTVALSSVFMYSFPYSQLSFFHKTHMEYGLDGGVIEASYDGGETWQNVLDDPVYRPLVVGQYQADTLQDGQMAFTGVDGWKYVGLCWGTEFGETPAINDTVYVKFTMYSDDQNKEDEGWMIDDFEVVGEIIGLSTDEERQDLVVLSPNPSQDFLDIDLSAYNSEKNIISILSPTGELLKSKSVSSSNEKHRISLRDVQAGSYYVHIWLDQGIMVKPFIKME